MPVAAPNPPSTPPRVPLPLVGKGRTVEWWVRPLRVAALAVFVVLPVYAAADQKHAGRVTWTVLVAALPVFIVLVGYPRWRDVCPLSFFAKLPGLLGRGGRWRVHPWLQENKYYVPLAVFVVSLWLRLVATNGNGVAIATFFAAIALAALVSGLLFTGKTWCNFFCPVSFVEKIYTEPQGLTPLARNSECATCSKCCQPVRQCPDIDEEQAYLQEIESPSKRWAYLAFPGLVYGFYLYFYLQSGHWSYYFGGSWVREADVPLFAFLPGRDEHTAGFFFLPAMPRAVAAAVTLAGCALASCGLFALLERLLRRLLPRWSPRADGRRVRHVVLTLAAFTAFVTFYSFAGQPTLLRVPGLSTLAVLAAGCVATLSLLRRLPWQKTEADDLALYESEVRDTLRYGLVAAEDVRRLRRLREHLHIAEDDHRQVLAALTKAERGLLTQPGQQVSAKRKQKLTAYAQELEDFLEERRVAGGPVDQDSLSGLMRRHRARWEEHQHVLGWLPGAPARLAERLAEELEAVERASAKVDALAGADASAAQGFLCDLVRRRRRRAAEQILHTVSLAPEDLISTTVREGLCSDDGARRQAALDRLRAGLPPEFAAVPADLPAPAPAHLGRALQDEADGTDPYERAAALLVLRERGAVDPALLDRLRKDEHPVVRELADACAGNAAPPGRKTVAERMLALRSVDYLSSLAPEGLELLARTAEEAAYPPEGALCVVGQPSRGELFVVLRGEVRVFHVDAAGNERLVDTRREGHALGHTMALDPTPRVRTSTLRAGAAGADVLRVNGESFHDILNQHPGLTREVIRTLAQKLRAERDGSDLAGPVTRPR